MQPGTYLGTYTKGIVSQAKTSGSVQAAVTFDVTHVAVDGDWKPLDATVERTLYLSMAGGAKDYTKKKLKALGYQTTEQDGTIRFDADVVGKPVELKCTSEMYNGEQKERWDLANWGGGGAAPADDSGVMKFAALMDE